MNWPCKIVHDARSVIPSVSVAPVPSYEFEKELAETVLPQIATVEQTAPKREQVSSDFGHRIAEMLIAEAEAGQIGTL